MSEDNTNSQEQQTPVPGSDEYNEMMANKFREANEGAGSEYPDTDTEDNQEETPQVPEGIPAKFIKEDGSVDYEALAKSYVELEKMKAPKAEDTEQSSGEEGVSEDADKAAKVVADAGLDMETLRNKIVSGEGLQDSDYEALEKAGVHRDIVDDYIKLRQDKAERSKQEALDYIGGEKQAQDLMTWASQNLSEDEVDAYNNMLAGPSWKAAVDTLRTLQGGSKATANEPNLSTASGSTTGTPTGYVSRDDMKADMANPLYHKAGSEGDKFRAEVQRKVAFAAWRRS